MTILKLSKTLIVTVFLLSCADSKSSTDYVLSESRLNKDVGHVLISEFKSRFEEYFCFEQDLSVLIVDLQRTSDKLNAESKKSYNLIQRWNFESNYGLMKKSFDSHQDAINWYTRPESFNQQLSHELGHIAFRKFIVPKGQGHDGYGSSAPDWLDEAAAMQNESTTSKNNRRAEFKTFFSMGEIYSLETLLNMKHPGVKINPDLAFGTKHEQELIGRRGQLKTRGPTKVSMWNEQKKQVTIRNGSSDDASLFYSQSFVFAEFLQYTANDKCYLSEIAKHGLIFTQDTNLRSSLSGFEDVEALEVKFHEFVKSSISARTEEK